MGKREPQRGGGEEREREMITTNTNNQVHSLVGIVSW